MDEIKQRFQRCGIAAHEAEQIYRSFEKDLSFADLLDYLESVEVDAYVDKVQCKSNSK
jgi:hypothetical protein